MIFEHYLAVRLEPKSIFVQIFRIKPPIATKVNVNVLAATAIFVN